MPNYILDDNGKEVFSHYTAGLMVKNEQGGETYRTDYVFGSDDLQHFKNEVKTYAAGANLLFGGGTKLSQGTIDILNKEGYGSYIKEQFTSVPNWIVALTGVLTATTSGLRNNAKNTIAQKVGQKQSTHGHLLNTTDRFKSFMNSMSDAQAVVNSVFNNQGTILRITNQGKVYIRTNVVTGTYMNNGVATPTNVFYIQGNSRGTTKVVPVHPNTNF